MSSFDLALDILLKREGGLSVNTNDNGGITNKGISLRFLSQLGLAYDFNNDGEVNELEIRNLTDEQAKKIYFNEFWRDQLYADINSQSVTNYLFDTAVNIGVSKANKLVQRALKSWNTSTHILDDGIFGKQTLFEVNKASNFILPPLRSERSNYYRRIVDMNPSQEVFLKGWLNRAYSL